MSEAVRHGVSDAPALAHSALDRSEDLRDPARLASMWPRARMLTVAQGSVPVRETDVGSALAFRPATDWGAAPPPGSVLVGSFEGTDFWATDSAPTIYRHRRYGPDGVGAASVSQTAATVPASHAESHLATGTATDTAVPNDQDVAAAAAGLAPTGERLSAPSSNVDAAVRMAPIREVGPLLTADEASIAATAVALATWHAGAVFCTRCGRPTAPDLAGHSRTCPVGHQEFPRTDPAVIVLVHDGVGNAVLARQASWAPGRFSVLAGFAEAGESLEATVVREIGEEVDVAVRDIRYLGSQPWPFPRSLMIAFSARADSGAQLRARPGEIEEARWFTRAELRVLLADSADGATSADSASGITLPGPLSISRWMIEAFVSGDAGERQSV